MKISIAMATYNGAQYLKFQLQSFVEQTRQPDELIITDDCSTDETEAIVREFAKSAPFKVEFYRNENNLGYCGNFNAALMKTSGDLVFLSDQDDVWFPEKIEHMVGVVERNPDAQVVMNDASLTDGELNEVGLTKIGQIRSAGLPMTTFVMGCCAAVKRDFLELILPIPEGYIAHDNWIVLMAEGVAAKKVDPRTLQYYRRHGENESQFIANSLSPVTRFVHYKIVIRNLIANRNESERASLSKIQQLYLLKEGVFRSIERVDNLVLEEALSIFSRDIDNKITALVRRNEIRKLPRIKRIPVVMQLWGAGKYGDFNGTYSAIRDILFN